MKLTALIVAIIYLQGCTTLKVLDLAKGIEKGSIQETVNVESIWNDSLQAEFIICMKDYGNYRYKMREQFMLKIPNNLISQEIDERIQFKQRTISELKQKEDQHWWSWSPYQDRNTVKVYDLSVVVDDYSCNDPKASWKKIPALKAPDQIIADEAFFYRGESIKKMKATHEPFLIFSLPDKDSYSIETVCPYSKENNPCLLLVSKTQIQEKENPQLHYDEILSVNQLIWTSAPKPMWYLAIPFAVVADAVIVAVILTLIGAARGPGGA
ncbi:MAG: hypothetical protein HOP23_11770 [Methylococcaceae bacterium]|nr:hypothetical protein [Methylococcaceae bacterium]